MATGNPITEMNVEMRARTLSKRQRVLFLNELVKIPRYMRKRFESPTTKTQIQFIKLWNELVRGKLPCTPINLKALQALLDMADKERYATSPALLDMPA